MQTMLEGSVKVTEVCILVANHSMASKYMGLNLKQMDHKTWLGAVKTARAVRSVKDIAVKAPGSPSMGQSEDEFTNALRQMKKCDGRDFSRGGSNGGDQEERSIGQREKSSQ